MVTGIMLFIFLSQLCVVAQNTPEADGRQPQEKLAEQTEGLNGSDLLELCSRAAALAAEEHFQE